MKPQLPVHGTAEQSNGTREGAIPSASPRYRIVVEDPGRERSVDFQSFKLAAQAWGEAAWRYPPSTVRLIDRYDGDREMASN